MAKIVISYRRHDSDAITGRIFDRLVTHYGAESVFRDIDNIPPGLDFRKSIGHALESTDILLAVVGPQWAGKSTDGRTRIREATDLVRIEVELALRRDIPVVPVLVGSAVMPEPGELPEGLQDFSFRNALKVDALEDFEDHVRRLIRSLDRLLETRRSDPPPAATPATAGAVKPAEAPTAPVVPTAPPKASATPPQPARDIVVQPPAPPERTATGPTTSEQPTLAAPPALILPAVATAVYVILWATGLWGAIQVGIFAPVPPAAQAILLAVAFWKYGGAVAWRSLLAAAVLWVCASIISAAYSTLVAAIPGMDARLGLLAVDLLLGAILVMGVGAALCPALRRPGYWATALVLWPGLGLAFSALTPLILQAGLERSAIGAVFFATFVVRQAVVFACLGHWLAQGQRSR